MSKEHEYHTFVFEGEMGTAENPFHTKFCGMTSVAWAMGHQLAAKDKIEDFIRDLAAGAIEEPEKAAQKLMEEMNWG